MFLEHSTTLKFSWPLKLTFQKGKRPELCERRCVTARVKSTCCLVNR